jgi:hypothetical protein
MTVTSLFSLLLAIAALACVAAQVTTASDTDIGTFNVVSTPLAPPAINTTKLTLELDENTLLNSHDISEVFHVVAHGLHAVDKTFNISRLYMISQKLDLAAGDDPATTLTLVTHFADVTPDEANAAAPAIAKELEAKDYDVKSVEAVESTMDVKCTKGCDGAACGHCVDGQRCENESVCFGDRCDHHRCGSSNGGALAATWTVVAVVAVVGLVMQ